jgi:hypothetical protein
MFISYGSAKSLGVYMMEVSTRHDVFWRRLAFILFSHDPPSIHFPILMLFNLSGIYLISMQLILMRNNHDPPGTQPWETPIGKVIEGMENAENFYSYGDMPPWGKGPAQGKIHGHPEYIQNEFPLIDSFIHCKTERLTGGGGSDTWDESKVLRKADGISDEEKFQQQRRAAEEAAASAARAEEAAEAFFQDTAGSQHHSIGLNKSALAGVMADPANIVFIVGAAVLVAGVALIVFLLRSNRKVSSKTS